MKTDITIQLKWILLFILLLFAGITQASADSISSISGPNTITKGQTITVNVECRTTGDNELHFSLQQPISPWTGYHYEKTQCNNNGKTPITFTVPNTIPDGTALIYQGYIVPKGRGWADRVDVKLQTGVSLENIDKITSITGPIIIEIDGTVTVTIDCKTVDSELNFTLQKATSPWTGYYGRKIQCNNNGETTVTFRVPTTIPEGIPLMYQAYIAPKGRGWADRIDVKWQKGITLEASDTTKPNITLKGLNPLNLNVGDTYNEAGTSATDNLDGDISSKIVISGDTVDTSTTGTYTVVYTVSDIAGNEATTTRDVIVHSSTSNNLLKGVNLAGAEFGETNSNSTNNSIMKIDHAWYRYPNKQEIAYFVDKGMTVFRLPFSWERLQLKFNAPLETKELNKIITFVQEANAKGAKVILDVHNFARYNNKLIGSSDVSIDAFSDLWSRLANVNAFKNNPKVIFGLMNEPYDIDAKIWANIAQQGIDAIRDTGAKNLILVPGTKWTGAHSWTTYSGNAEAILKINDFNYAIEVHQYLDSDSSGGGDGCVDENIGVERLRAFTSWLKTNGIRGFLGEFGGVNGNITCSDALKNMLRYIESNNAQWIGWTYWAAGYAWSQDYKLSIQPKKDNNGKYVDHGQMDILSNFLKVNSSTNVDTISSISGPKVIHKGQSITVNVDCKTTDNELNFSLQKATNPWTGYYVKSTQCNNNGKTSFTFTIPTTIPDGTPLMYQAYIAPKGKGWADRMAVKWQSGIKIDNSTKNTWLKRTPIPQTNYNPKNWSLGEVYTVTNWEQYQEAFKTVKAGDLVWFPAGTKIEVIHDKSGYEYGFENIHGTADKKIYLSTDIDNPAVISGGRIPIHFRDNCSYIEISNIKIDRAAERGIQLGLVAREDGVGGSGIAKTILGTVSHIDIINVELTNIGNAAICISSAHDIHVLGGSIHGTFNNIEEPNPASEGVYIGDGNYNDESEERYGLRLDNHHIVIRGMDIYDRGSEAIDLKARSREVLIEENHIWNVGRHGEWNPAIIVMWRDYQTLNNQGNYNSNVMIRRNHIHNCGGYGIAIGSGGGNVIESNIIHDGLAGKNYGVKNGIEIRQTFQPNYNRLSIRNNTVIRHNRGGGAIKYNTYKHTAYENSSPSVAPQLFKTGQNLVDGKISTELLGDNSVELVNVNQFVGPTKDAADAHNNGQSPSGTGSGFALKSNTSIDIAPAISNKDYRGMNLSGTSRIGAINSI